MVSDLQSTLDAIDQLAVHECGQCQRPLRPNGPSPDFCGQWCQEAWVRAKQEIIDLTGYEEPCDLAAHAFNLVELRSSEVTPQRPDDWPDRPMSYGGELTFELRVDTSGFIRAMERLYESVRQLWEPIPDSDRVLARLSSGWVSFRSRQNGRSRLGFTAGPPIFDEITNWSPTGLRLTVPDAQVIQVADPDEPPFGSDFNFEWTPAKTLPHEPLPALMPSAPEPDWQAIVDAATAHTGPQQRRMRAPRHLGRPQR